MALNELTLGFNWSLKFLYLWLIELLRIIDVVRVRIEATSLIRVILHLQRILQHFKLFFLQLPHAFHLHLMHTLRLVQHTLVVTTSKALLHLLHWCTLLCNYSILLGLQYRLRLNLFHFLL